MGGHLAGSNMRTINVCVRHLAFFTLIAVFELGIISNNVLMVHVRNVILENHNVNHFCR